MAKVNSFDREKYIQSAIKLAEFYTKNNRMPTTSAHKDLIEDEITLGAWRFTQTSAYTKGSLSEEKIAILNQICPCIFENRRKSISWEQRYDELVNFMKMNLKIPASSSNETANKQLGAWLQHNLRMHKLNKLDRYKAAKLAIILPQYFNGKIEDSLIYKITSKCVISNSLPISELQSRKLATLGITDIRQVIKLITSKMDNNGIRNDLANAVMTVLNVYIDFDYSNAVVKQSPTRVPTNIHTRINELIYGVPTGKIQLALAIFNGFNRDDKYILYYANRYLDTLLKTLTKKEETVIIERFYNLKTQEEIGNRLEVTGSRIGEIEAKALRKLRHPSRMAILNGKELETLITQLVPREDLLNVKKLAKYKKQLSIIEMVVEDIKRQNKANCSTEFILGLAYLDILKYKGIVSKLDEIETEAKRLSQLSVEYNELYKLIFEQESSIDNSGGVLEFKTLLENKITNSPKNETINIVKANTPIEELGLSARAYNVLKRANYNSIDEVIQAIEADTLADIHFLGRSSAKEIGNKVKNYIIGQVTNEEQ